MIQMIRLMRDVIDGGTYQKPVQDTGKEQMNRELNLLEEVYTDARNAIYEISQGRFKTSHSIEEMYQIAIQAIKDKYTKP